ncbi:MAG: 3-oxoacyl-ACP synthase III family protein [Crocinitomicaceae bacterium]
MAKFAIDKIKIEAIYSCVPSQKIKTSEYSLFSDYECLLFEKTTGIKERRVAWKDLTCSDLCFKAAESLLTDLKIDREEIDVLIFVSQSPDYFLPATAIILQEKLGLAKNCMAFDVNLGCSGYVYGLSVLSSLLKSGLKKGLLLAGDKSTISTSFNDKSTYPLFGDAGTVTLLSFDENAESMFFDLHSDGSGKDAIMIEYGHSRFPYNTFIDEEREYEPGIKRSRNHLTLDGMKVFNFALKEVAQSIDECLQYAENEKESVDFFVLHQANKLINDSVRKKMKLPEDKFPMSIDNFGNTSSASIPLTICTSLKKQIEDKELTLLLSGFGVGLSWANVLLKMGPIPLKCFDYD